MLKGGKGSFCYFPTFFKASKKSKIFQFHLFMLTSFFLYYIRDLTIIDNLTLLYGFQARSVCYMLM